MLRRIFIALVTISLLFAAALFIEAAESPYTEGSVWGLSFVRTEASMQGEYVKNLQANWKKVMDAAVSEGLIVSYKVMIGESANPDDWDVLLMVEYKNWAAFDNIGDKFDVLTEKILGGQAEQIKMNIERGQIREIFGGKTMQEISIK